MFKVGDKVNVSNFGSGINYKSATIVHIDSNDVPLPYLVIVKSSRSVWCSGNDLELIPPTPKEMLKVGMVVELDNGGLRIVCQNRDDNLILNDKNGDFIEVDNYDEQLKCDLFFDYNIKKIYSLSNKNYNLNEISTINRILIWERKPEYYNGKVVCINDNNSIFFTKGKVYKVEKGIVDNDGHTEPHYFDAPIKSIDDLNSRSSIKFIELVED